MDNNYNSEKLAKNIQVLRINKLMSQEKLADNLDVSLGTIGRWEKRQNLPSLFYLASMTKVFNISLDELVFGNIKEDKEKVSLAMLRANKKNNVKDKEVIADLGEEDDEAERVFFPYVKPSDFISYQAFIKAYNINVDIDNTGNRSRIGEMMDLYEEAFQEGLVEAGANILKIVVNTIMHAKAFHPEDKLPFQDRLYYIDALEEADHLAGGFYRAFVLIYGLMYTDKTEEENMDDGLLLMHELAIDGNELALQYLEYIEKAASEED